MVLRVGKRETPFGISGQVTDGAGRPVQEVSVAFLVARTGLRVGRVAFPDAKGNFEMRNLDELPYHVQIVDWRGRYQPARMENVNPPADNVDFVLVEKE